ncbi:DUF1292 domain-containing protein [Cohnella pontilimi]|uniref:UPF0473 protein E5161_06450 n=1 Tax=Cohnella pontilimi TaxID=2564100 RepID=A0A4U0FGJ6_9BACL|nr:DUF1292 domain-containing protein [Cohnella pontilimi]TJY43514.1 DUF1292 domain-containing protein [Cohnella pontilimi]
MSDEKKMPEEEAEIIYIPDDEGNDEAFEVIMRFELDDGSDRKYLMVVPAEEDPDEEQEVFAFRYEEENDEIKLFAIEEQEEWDMVEETFNTLMNEFGDAEADAEGKS